MRVNHEHVGNKVLCQNDLSRFPKSSEKYSAAEGMHP